MTPDELRAYNTVDHWFMLKRPGEAPTVWYWNAAQQRGFYFSDLADASDDHCYGPVYLMNHRSTFVAHSMAFSNSYIEIPDPRARYRVAEGL